MQLMRLRFLLLLAAMAWALAACEGKQPTPLPEYQVGDEDFVTTLDGDRGYGRGGGAEMMSAGAAPGGAEDSAKSSAPQPQRGIEEADIYKVSGNTLFILNAYRGLQIIDISDLSAPKLKSRVPLIGRPVDLYVRDNTAYIAVSDYFWYGCIDAADGDSSLVAPSRGSRVWTVDVSDTAKPVVLGKLPIDGDVDETRIVGNVLYVESRRYSYWYYDARGGSQREDLTFVQSFDISNPRDMKPVDRLDFPAAGWETHANVTAERITLSQSAYRGDGPVTQFRIIDISNPTGKLALGGAFESKGIVRDRWGMDYDAATGLFRVIQQANWGNNGAALRIFKSPTPAEAVEIGHLNIDIPESLTAARFDGNRAYLVTARCSDPLWVVDTSNPSAPQLKGHLEMPGRLDFVEPRGDRLVAMGHDSAGCGGSGTMNVSLFDVADPAHPTMLSRVSFGGDYTYVNAEADDFRKVFQVLDALNMILVPYQSWNSNDYRSEGGTQFVDFTRDSLTKRGFVQHSGAISRAFPVRDRIVAMSDNSLQVIDASNRDAPVETAALDLARPVSTMVVKDGYTIQLSGDWYRGDTELVVTPANDPEASVPLARLKVAAPYASLFRDGDIVWLMSYRYSYTAAPRAHLQAVDISNPLQLTLRGKLELDPNDIGYGGYGFNHAVYGATMVKVGHTLVSHPYYYSYRCDGCSNERTDALTVIDLSNPDAPAMTAKMALPTSDGSYGVVSSGGYAWVTHRERQGLFGNGVRHYLDRLDVSNPRSPVLLSKINIPGVFFGTSPDGKSLYTVESRWSYDEDSSSSTSSTAYYQLALSRNRARLLAKASLPGHLGNAIINGEHLYSQSSNYSEGQYRSTLWTMALDGLSVTDRQALGAQWAWLAKVAGGKLFLSAGWYNSGVLVYDLTHPEAPAFDGFIRTEGYVSDIVVDGATAYLPSGAYGVPTVDLTAGSRIAAQD